MDSFEKNVIDRLARIEQRLADRDSHCSVHDQEIYELKASVGKQNLVAATLGALGTGLVLLAQYLLKMGHTK